MKRHIDRIYKTKNIHYTDNEYESVGEMNRNIHKKEPYIFTVTATNSVGDSVSDPTSDIVPIVSPTAPTSISATSNEDGQSTVTFSNNNTFYGGSVNVTYTVTSNPENKSATLTVQSSDTSTTKSVIVTGLTNGKSYTFTVKSTNTAGDSANSVASSSIIPNAQPITPVITKLDAGDRKVTVNFTQSTVGGDNRYIITVLPTIGNEVPLPLTVLTSPCEYTGLTNGTEYKFTVTVKNSLTDSKSLNIISNEMRSTPNVLPNAPTNVVAVALTTVIGNADITFTPSTVGYNNTYTITSNTGNKTTTVTPTSSTSGNLKGTITGLTPGSSYTFSVISTNNIGESPSSTSSNSITIANKPLQPTNLSASGNNNSIKIQFDIPDSNGSAITSYKIRGFFTDSSNSVKYEEINVPLESVKVTAINGKNVGTFTLNTTNQLKFVTSSAIPIIPTKSSDLDTYVKDANKITTNPTLSLSTVQGYDKVPLLYYPIGSEREGYYYNDVKNNKTVQNYNKFIYILRIIFIIFVILVLLTNDKIKNKIKVFVKSIFSF
jgi:hypothetical protein